MLTASMSQLIAVVRVLTGFAELDHRLATMLMDLVRALTGLVSWLITLVKRLTDLVI